MADTLQRVPFSFTGDGREYFKIWVNNLFLSLVTLGVYSAWAKVRRMKYFCQHTRLGDSAFDYHGDPKALLRGRVVVVVALAASFVFPLLNVVWVVLAPWLICQSLRFSAANMTYRGVRFGFVGALGGAYRVFLLEFLYVIFSLGLLYPLWSYRRQKYVYDNLRYGDQAFHFGAPLGKYCANFFACWVWAALIAVVGAVVLGGMVYLKAAAGHAAFDAAEIAQFLGYVLLFTFTAGYLAVKNGNLVLNHLGLGPTPAGAEWAQSSLDLGPVPESQLHRFESRYALFSFLKLSFVNTALTIVTLGFYRPFAAVRLAQYQADHRAVLLHPALADAQQSRSGTGSVLGSEGTDVGGMDLGL